LKSDNNKKESSKIFTRYQKFNSILSILFIALILLFSLLIKNPIVIIIVIPIIIIGTIYEQKADYCPLRYSKYIFLLSSLVILASIVFWILPSIIDIMGLNIQFIIFNLLFYLTLQIFAKKKYFAQENIIIIQHILGISIFFLIAYSFFPIISFDYLNFTSDLLLILLSNVFLHSILIFSVSLVSFYYLYARYFYKKPWKNFNLCITCNILLIETTLYIILNFKNFFLVNLDIFLGGLTITLILFPIIFLIFVLVNFLIGIFSSKTGLTLTYYSLWFLIFIIFSSLILNFYTNPIIILLDLLFLSLFSSILLKFGGKMEKVKETTIILFNKINSILIFSEVIILLFLFFFNLFTPLEPMQKIITSAYCSLITFTIVNIIFLKEKIISISLSLIIEITSLLYTTVLVYYYFFSFTLGSYYVLIIPILFSSIIFYLPIFYFRTKTTYKRLSKNLLILNSFVLAITLTLIPTIVGLELISFGQIIDVITFLNYTLYILYGILAFIFLLSKIITIRTKNIEIILKSLTLIELFLTITTFFYYPYIFLSGTAFSLLFPAMAASIFLFLPIIFSFKKKFFSEAVIKKAILLNSLFLWGCIISTPSFIGLQFFDLGIPINLTFVVVISIMLFFLFLKYLGVVSTYINLKENFIISIKLTQVITWFITCVLVSFELSFFLFSSSNWSNYIIISISLLIFFVLHIYNLYQLDNLKQAVFENKRSKFDYYKIYKVYEYNKNIIFFGIIFSVSFIITSLIPTESFIGLIFPSNIQFLSLISNLLIFSLISLVLFKLSDYIIEIEFNKAKRIIEFTIWLAIKSIISFILIIYPFPISILNHGLLIILGLSLLFPFTIYYLKKLMIFLERTLRIIKRIIGISFFLSLLAFYTEIFWILTSSIPYFSINPIILITVISCILILFTNFYFSKFNEFVENESEFRIYLLYGTSFLLLGAFTYFNSLFTLLLLLIAYIIVLSQRNRNLILRLLCYVLLSYLVYAELIALFDFYLILSVFGSIPTGFYICVQILIIISILFLSIILNVNRRNTIEKFSLYSFMSIFSFVYFLTYTIIPIIYNFTISLFIFLSLIGIFFYRQKDDRYKWFIRPCILLFIFDSISFLSYAVFFRFPPFNEFNLILSFTLTLFVTGFAFVFVYNKSPTEFRKRSFYIVLASNTLSFPVFLYFFLIAALSLPLVDPIILTISINTAIFLFYLSVGIFQWKISWAIWRVGWWLWIIFPLTNFYIINKGFTGVDVYTNALTFFGVFNINGSFILTFMTCILLSLPFWYTWIKKHFSYALFFVWGLSLFLIYWFSQNIFAGNILLTNVLFIVFSVLLLVPIFYRLKFWKILTLLWLISTIINVSFLSILLIDIGMPFMFNLPINIILAGIFFIILSFFPNLKAQKGVILIISYFVAILGAFLLIFNILNIIFLNTWISINLSSIIIALSLFSSRVFKLNQKIINFFISLILTVNFTLITYSTFILIPNFQLFAIFFAITICGGSLLIFGRLKMMLPIKKIISLSLLSFGLSSTISSLIFILTPNLIFLISSVFVLINLIFIYSMLEEFRFVMWYLIPIPISLLILQGLFLLELFQPFLHLVLTGLMLYTAIFQILINAFNKDIEESEDTKKKLNMSRFFEDKNQIKILNLICFILNSTYFSIFISLISPFLIIYQVLEFLIIWSIFILLSFGYIKSSGVEIEIKNLTSRMEKLSSLIAFFLYFEIFILSIYLLFEFTNLNITENSFISCTILFILTSLDIFSIKKVSKKAMYPINNVVYLITTIFFFIFLNQFLVINPQFLLLNIIILLILQFYSLYTFFSFLKQFSRFDVNKLVKLRKQIQSGLLNIIFFIISLYIASNLSIALTNYITVFVGLPSVLFFLMIFSISMFIFNLSLKIKLKYILLLGFFLTFQITSLFFWLFLSIVFNFINFFGIFLILIFETGLSYYPIFSIKKIFSERVNLAVINKAYLFLLFILYLEFSFLFYGLANLFLGIFESILISQTILIVISLLEVYIIYKVKSEYMRIVHMFSYFNFSWSLFIILYQISQSNVNLINFAIVLFILMQFYTNHSYFITRKKFNAEKETSFKKWKLLRQKLLGITFYLVLLNFFLQILIQMNIEVQLILLISTLIIHGLMLMDRYILKFIGSISNHVIVISWILIIGFSFLYLSSWILLFTTSIIPVIILILLVEFVYLFKMLEFWQIINQNKDKIKKSLMVVFYLDIITWPLYYFQTAFIVNLNLFLLSILLLLIFSIVDNALGAIKENVRKKIRSYSFLGVALLLAIDTFSYLEFIVAPNLPLNLSVSTLIFTIFMGILFNPFKRSRLISFLYWTLIFFLLSFILYSLFLHGLGWTLLIFGIILYPFIFMLEELKELFNHLIDYLSALYIKIKNGIITISYKIYNFLQANFKIIRILFCIFVGILSGVLASVLSQGWLHPVHAVLISLAVFGICFGLIPAKKAREPDEIFYQQMRQFSTIWIGITGFIFTLILPYITSILFGIILVIPPILGLGATLLLFIYRKEKKEKISIKWRFYTTTLSIILFVFWIVVLILFYFVEVRI